MSKNTMQNLIFKNVDRPFTELFALLKRYDFSVENVVSLDYNSNELVYIEQHAGNAIDALLQGLKCIGDLMSTSKAGKIELISDAGNLISLICDLIEALINTRLDVDASL